VAQARTGENRPVSNLREPFESQGYVVLERAIPTAQLASIQAAALSIVERFDSDRHRTVFSTRNQRHAQERYFLDSAENVHCFLEEEAVDADGRLLRPKSLAVNKIGHALHDLVPEFREFCCQPAIVQALRSAGYAAAELWQTMYIFKQPGIGGEVRWHQDAAYLHTLPPAVVGLWVAVEDAHKENGCLWVQPGGHKTPLREIYEVDHDSGSGTLRTLDSTPWPQSAEAVALEVPAGSLVMFSDHLPHYSSSNRSERSRHAFTMHFAPAGAHWSERNWLQRRRLPSFVL
jgi:phytanoyl-CoA hydroxylase